MADATLKLSPTFFRLRLSPSKRHHFTVFSSQNPNLSSGSRTIKSNNKPLNPAESLNANKTIALIKDSKNDNVSVKLNSNREIKRNFRFCKGLFGKESLWRRVLFASRKLKSILLLNVITIVYASDIPIVKEAESVVDPATFTVVRFIISAIPFVPFIVRAWDDDDTRNAGIELGVWVSLGYLMQALGLLTSDAGRASFLSMLTVIVVPVLDGMLGTTVPAQTWFGALMSIVGIGMLESSGSPPCVGDLLNFLSAVFFGVHMLRTQHVSRRTKTSDFLPLLGYEVCVIAFLSTMWYFLSGWFGDIQSHNLSSWTWNTVSQWMAMFPWMQAIYTGVFSTALCLWIELAAMHDVSATETAIIYGLEPLWGAGFAWFLLGERWGTTGWIGAAFVLCGSMTVQIFGSLSSEDEEKRNKVDDLSISDDRNGFNNASPVRVSSSKDMSTVRKK